MNQKIRNVICVVFLLVINVSSLSVSAFDKELRTENVEVDENGASYVPGELIVKFKDNVKAERTLSYLKKFRTYNSHKIPLSIIEDSEIIFGKNDSDVKLRKAEDGSTLPELKIHSVKLKKGISVKEALNILKRDENVESASPNYVRKVNAIPNDFFFGKKFDYAKNGTTKQYDYLYHLNTIGAQSAWDSGFEGHNVVVGIFDTGVELTNRDLIGNIFINSQEIANDRRDNDGNGYIDDVNGYDFYNGTASQIDFDSHGTALAGIIAGLKNNTYGVAGVAPQVKILSLKIGEYGDVYDDLTIRAIDYAISLKNRNNLKMVFNFSFSGLNSYNQLERDAIIRAKNAGILSIAAIGNDNVQVDNELYVSPGGYSEVLAVAGSDFENAKASFSNYGSVVDVSAPGALINSLYSYDAFIIPNESQVPISVSSTGVITRNDSFGDFIQQNGTSFSAPIVAGVAALVLSKNPNIPVDRLEKILKSAATINTTALDGKSIPKIVSVQSALNLTCSTTQKYCGDTCIDINANCGGGTSLTLCRNPVNSLDVNGDGKVTPIDALLIINKLNSGTAGNVSCTSAPYYDVNGDGKVTPIDALLVINGLPRY